LSQDNYMNVSVKFEYDYSYGIKVIYLHIVRQSMKEIIIIDPDRKVNTYKFINYTSDAEGFMTDVNKLKDEKKTLIKYLFKGKMKGDSNAI